MANNLWLCANMTNDLWLCANMANDLWLLAIWPRLPSFGCADDDYHRCADVRCIHGVLCAMCVTARMSVSKPVPKRTGTDNEHDRPTKKRSRLATSASASASA